MRIRDWSSDVCSSDLAVRGSRPKAAHAGRGGGERRRCRGALRLRPRHGGADRAAADARRIQAPPGAAGGQAVDPQLRPRPALSDHPRVPDGVTRLRRESHYSRAMTVTTRFAPAPTGNLHVGNVRTALHNWLWARKHGGRFLLRIDDTDRERSREEHVAAIRADLAWLGLDVDGAARQSERFALYEAEFERLEATGRVYACYETPEELEIRRQILQNGRDNA